MGHEGAPLFLNNPAAPRQTTGAFIGLFARLHTCVRTHCIDFQSYRMRHTGITNWARAGVVAPIFNELAGQESIVTTQNYIGRLSRSDLARIPHAFSEVYGRAVSRETPARGDTRTEATKSCVALTPDRETIQGTSTPT